MAFVVPLKENQIRFIVAELLQGLEDMHKECICHRDLKPDNILFDSNGHVKICDFGEANTYNENSLKELHEYIERESDV